MSEDLHLIHNGKIYVSGERDYTWMLFDGESGYIRSLGRDDPPIGDAKQENVVDCSGHRILPGLHESHIHVGSYGLHLMHLCLSGCGSIEEFQQKLSAFAVNHPDRAWIMGFGWEQDVLGRYPTREDLDLACPDRPVLLFRACLHIAVVNSKALEITGIHRDTSKPDDGEIDHYPNDHHLAGEPTGIIRECVYTLFATVLTPTEEDKKKGMIRAVDQCLRHGVTSLHALEGSGTWDVLCDMVDHGQLPNRVFYVPYWLKRHTQTFPSPGQHKGKLLSCDRVKIFSDGSLGACTAAISMPYKDKPDNKGIFLYPQDQLNIMASSATSLGYRLEVHAIGDAAADAVLTSFETGKVTPEKRPIIVHCQILRQDLLERMKTQGVIASIQPQFVPTDARWVGELLPEQLQEYAYPWKTLLDYGIACCGGSDAPVESPEPLIGIYDAIFRPTGTRGSNNMGCYRPEERLSVREAIDLYTKGGAYATMREHDLGQLLPGYQADFIIMDTERDPVEHPQEFCTTRVGQVWVAGERKL